MFAVGGGPAGTVRRFFRVSWLMIIPAAVIALGPSPAAPAKTPFPKKIEIAGKKLTLVGAGERTRFFNTVYRAGLYLERPTKIDHKAIASEQVKQIRLQAKNLTRRKLIDTLNRGLYDNNPSAKLKAIGPRIEKFIRLFKTTKPRPGDWLVLTYVPKKGTAVTFRSKKLGLIKGRDFMRALFAVWLGENPASAVLKHKMLGQ